jgi:hypothetical protein
VGGVHPQLKQERREERKMNERVLRTRTPLHSLMSFVLH